MKRVFLIVVLALSLTSAGLFADQAFAAGTNVLTNGGAGSPCSNPNAVATPSFCADKAVGNPISGPGGVLSEVTGIVLYIVGILAVIMVIISGIRMATANGDSSAFNSARTGLIYAVIGLAVAILARAIVLFIVNKL